MAGKTLRPFVILGLTAGLLAACQAGTGGSDVTTEALPDAGAEAAAADGAVTPARSVKLVDRDVEAPDDFQTTAKALWDGRPSIGGVWVAATNVTDPMRVILRNPANGKFVIGALFRREADNPGPPLQISSDAADALGMTAGEPAEISVTALRREEVAAPEPDATRPLLDTSETVAGAEDVAAAATAAIEAAPAAEPEPEAAQPAAAPAPEASPAPAPVAGGKTIQIGIFSVEANAKRAVDALARAGIAATVRQETSHGKPLWSVVAQGDKAVLAKIKSAGFADAYFL